jgi:uncharacterized protein with HEPN domain
MYEACREVMEFAAGRRWEDYCRDKMLRAAIERKVEVIGEAARNISAVFKKANYKIPWQAIMAQRHRLAHEYGDIDDNLIWKVATVHVPELMALLGPLLPPEPPDPEK